MGAALAALVALSACDPTPRTTPFPQTRPAGLAPVGNEVTPQSAASQDLARYYEKVQNDLLTRGLLRTDGGGPDTPYDANDLARNFETIAFFDEYRPGGLTSSGRGSSGQLSRWSGPVRVNTEFGASVPLEQRATDKANVDSYVARLARITGHPISTTSKNANFHVFVAGEDDSDFLQARLKQLIPSISREELAIFRDLPQSFYCLVVAVSGNGTPYNYTRAVALIRAEHPDLVRLSCVHEEIAQGLGLPNDSPRARPSIFNDDDEFALLTSHDEKLLMMLYDPRLKQGITAEEARPVVNILAREAMGQSL
ncbi:DUF2927 domain-containing protein [Tropicibacter sp. R16_0]|uniref:DUF2927 domain-containing protein n=1 Tax=Tropicibacter sp. R16_0 TaxID=2821102 RepID=UPI001ADC3B3E|nr:DUF2927 domain-containing protein [Tropicibacter sp. R16_0]MBO9449237.1 DUF2927 domain-containing protein [Tropicibacter sp. R16_0]